MPLPPQLPTLQHKPPLATIQNLHKLIYEIPLPKTPNAKQCTIPLNTIHDLCSIAAILVQQNLRPQNLGHSGSEADTSTLKAISSQLEALTTKINTLSSPYTPPPPSRTFADILKTPAPVESANTAALAAYPLRPQRNTKCDLVLSPINSQSPAFQSVTPANIKAQFNTLLEKLQLCEDWETQPSAAAIAKHRNSNICITLQTPDEAKQLQEAHTEWLPAFSPLLQLRTPSFAVIIH
jgi:hypothetical protein